MDPVKGPPASTKASLTSRLNAHARQHWPELTRINVRFRAGFAYIEGQLDDDTRIKLCRLRYGGSATLWGFAMYRASHDDYEDSILPTGSFASTPEDALDCAACLYLTPYQ